MVACRIYRTFKFLMRSWAWLFMPTFAVFWCGCIWSQTLPESRLSDPTSEQARSWDMASHQPRPSTGVPGQQLVTANALRAPDKARNAAQKAAKAIQEHKLDEATKQVERALDAYPEYAFALTLRGLLHLRAAPTEAIADLNKAILLDPAFALPYVILAGAYNDSESCNEALPIVTRAVQLLPIAWQVHFEMALTLCGRHQSADALREIGYAMRLLSGPTSTHEARAALHFWRGRILVDQQDFSSAKVEFQYVLSEEPNGIFAQISSTAISRLEAAAIR